MATVPREPQDSYPLCPSPVVAEALLDRLLNSAHFLIMQGKSYRERPRAWEDRALLRKSVAAGNKHDH